MKRNTFGWIIGTLLVLSLLFIGLYFFSFSSPAQKIFSNRIQKAVALEEGRIQNSKQALFSALDSIQVLPNQSFEYIALPVHSDLYLFSSDSLIWWNANQIEPRYLRKSVPLESDTIVHLSIGDYLVCSGHYLDYDYYLYSLVNTTYPFENDYFVNRFQLLLGPRQIEIDDNPSGDSFSLYSSTGKLLGYYRLTNPSSYGFTSPRLLILSLVVFILALYLLILRRLHRLLKAGLPPSQPGLRTYLPFLVLLVFFVFTVLDFKALFHYGFEHDFFIPIRLTIGYPFFYFFLHFLVFVSLLLLVRRLFSWITTLEAPLWKPMLLYGILLALISWMLHFHWMTAVFGILIMLIFVVNSRNTFHSRLLSESLLLVFWGLLFTHVYDREVTKYENQGLQTLAMDLADERDPEFERSYHQFLTKAQHDTAFFSTVLSDVIKSEIAIDYIRNYLFDSVMNQYNVTLTLCNPGAELVVEPFDIVSDCMDYFQDKVNQNHGVDLGEGLAFLDYNTLDPSYLSMIDILVNDTVTDMSLFMEFFKPIAPQGFGLLSLLQDDNSTLPLNTSVACYQDSLLVYKYGSYVYPNFLSDFKHVPNDFSYGRKMKHYTYSVGDSRVITISVARHTFMEKTVPFVFFFVSLLLLYILIYFVGGMNNPVASTLSRKFQVMVLVALAGAFLVVGPVSVFYMRGVYTRKVNDNHFERTRTLLQDITSEVDFTFLKQPDFNHELDRILRRYSETFYTDINIYDLDGKLLATTSPEIQDLHLQASLMDPEAFSNMQGEKTLYYIHDEHLGRATYASTYVPIMDGMGNILAYLNNPYFSGRSGLRSEIVYFVLTYINIILLIVFVILPIILYFTRKVTDPLKQLQDRMRRVDINRSNELLEWKSNDEIGALVEQYNQLVVALEKSAAELRRTTTESAWRGVARQVAHEIKNSLTPMSLSVQLLQRTLEKGGDNMEERINRTAQTLLEQINALSEIAGSFSQYAKLPENHPQPLDLAELVGNVVNLYDNTENIDYQFIYDADQDYGFNGDKTNLNSAVTNLVKNATQAIGSKPDGKIIVSLKSEHNAFVISVQDNGCGIKEEDKKMIFLPNFTTKSGGSGVGLSLTYNIINSIGGAISFESEEGVGTTFVIELPKEQSV